MQISKNRFLTVSVVWLPFYDIGIKRLPEPIFHFDREKEKFEYFYPNHLIIYWSRRTWFTWPYWTYIWGKEYKVAGYSIRIGNIIINYWNKKAGGF